MGIKKYEHRKTNLHDIITLVESGLGIEEISIKTGKNNKWVKEQLIKHYNKDTIRLEIRRGRGGGLFLDGKKMNKENNA